MQSCGFRAISSSCAERLDEVPVARHPFPPTHTGPGAHGSALAMPMGPQGSSTHGPGSLKQKLGTQPLFETMCHGGLAMPRHHQLFPPPWNAEHFVGCYSTFLAFWPRNGTSTSLLRANPGSADTQHCEGFPHHMPPQVMSSQHTCTGPAPHFSLVLMGPAR